MKLTYEKFDLILAPEEHIVLSDPKDDHEFDAALLIEDKHRIITSLIPAYRKFSYFQHFDTDLRDNFQALIAVSDANRDCNIFIFLEEEVMDRLFQSLVAVAGSPFHVQIQAQASGRPRDFEGQRVLGIFDMPAISVSRRLQK